MIDNFTGLVLAIFVVVCFWLSGCTKNGVLVYKGPLVVEQNSEVEVTIRREGFDTRTVKGEWIEGHLYLDGEPLKSNDVRYVDAVLGIRVVR